LLDALLRAYWTELHPLIEIDQAEAGEPVLDLDARLAPLEWLNESLSARLRVHAVLVSVDAGKPTPVTLADWERMTIRETATELPAARNQGPAEVGLTRADIVDGVVHLQAELAWGETAIEDCQSALAAIGDLLRARLAALAPNLGKLATALDAARRVLAQLHDSVTQSLPEDDLRQEGDLISVDDDDDADADADAAIVAAGRAGTIAAARATAGANWRNRAEAYAALEALADYLAEVEPHSPTPFLLRRAVNWGRMSLPEVIAEIIREEGDVNRFFNALGVRQ
jgi:type VI secretion system protein ImpA